MKFTAMTWISALFTALGALAMNDDDSKGNAASDGPPPPVERTDFGWRAGDCVITTALPEGYPAPTAPGAIEIKQYPSVRRAEVTGEMNIEMGKNAGFWMLFQHIKKHDIAMTSPVEMDYHGWSGEERNPESWTMAFLYRTADLGPTGADGKVEVVDSEPVTVVSLGLRGSYTMANYQAALVKLNDWLAANPQWQRAGEPRSLAYNGPDVRAFKRWSELQIPVRQGETETSATTQEEAAECERDAAGDDA